jgi:hypothetical protein
MAKKKGLYENKKLYVIRKYVLALSASDAIRQEAKQTVDDVWLEEGYKNEAIKIGFHQ